MVIPNAEGESAAAVVVRDGGGERKRKRGAGARARAEPSGLAKWMTASEQKTYSSKLIEALRTVRRSSSSAASSAEAEHQRARSVRAVADRTLAIVARGRTRWSRAILTSRRIKLRVRPPMRAKPASREPTQRRKLQQHQRRQQHPVLEKKARALGRLVPGCRKLSLPTLLEEASDYIAALQMQVRAMSAIADIIAGSSSLPAAEPM